MSVTSGFFNSYNGDRKYNAEQMSAIFDGVINDGIFANIGTAFSVKAQSGKTVTVGIGRAWFKSTWIYNDAILPLEATESAVLLDRYDAVVIEVDRSTAVRLGTIKIIEGTPASTPQRPAMTKTVEVNQYPLAYLYRKAGSMEITQADITNMIGSAETPFVTGILQVIKLNELLGQWESQLDQFVASEESSFSTWFEKIKGQLSLDAAANIQTRFNRFNEVLSVKLLANGWIGNAAPYSQTVSVKGLQPEDDPLVVSMLADGASAADQKAYNKAFSCIVAGTGSTAEGLATFKVYKKPAIDITVGLKFCGGQSPATVTKLMDSEYEYLRDSMNDPMEAVL